MLQFSVNFVLYIYIFVCVLNNNECHLCNETRFCPYFTSSLNLNLPQVTDNNGQVIPSGYYEFWVYGSNNPTTFILANICYM